MPRNKRDVEVVLTKKGFREGEGHHRYFYYWTKGGKKTIAWTKTSHGAKKKDIGDHLLSHMAGQCKLTLAEFKNLLDCPMTRDDYEQTLRQKGLI